MSDPAPFEADVSRQTVSADTSEVFKPDLTGFNWDLYGARQEQINHLLINRSGEELGGLLQQFHSEAPDTGVMLNNLHGTRIKGPAIRGLHAALAVMSRSVIDLDIPGFNFKGGVAPEADFSGHDLSGSNFVNSVLTGSVFEGANLSGADLTNAVLNGANFKDAELGGTDFTGAYLVNVTGLSEEQVKKMKIQATRAIFMAPSGATSLEQMLLTRFGEAKSLEDILKFLDPVPVAVNADWDQPVGRLQAKRLLRGLYAEKANWTQADFTSADLTGATIEGLMANQVSFRAATIGGTVIKRAVMREADMVSTWAPGVVLEDVDLRDANFAKSNLVGAVLRGVDLRGVRGLSDSETNVEGLVIEESCLLPSGYGYDGVSLQISDKLKRELDK